MYTLHIANCAYSSWSLRPWALLHALGIPFETQLHPFVPGGSAERFRAFSPTGKVPVLHDGPTVVWDSLAIVEYVAERHPGVWPADPAARAWARCASAEMHAGFGALRQRCSFQVGLRVRLHTVDPALQRDLDRMDALWQEGLARFGGPYLAGATFTAVDAFFSPIPFRLRTYGLALGPAAMDYAARLLATPTLRAWDEAGLAEPFRDAEHDREIAAQGTILADLRAPERPA